MTTFYNRRAGRSIFSKNSELKTANCSFRTIRAGGSETEEALDKQTDAELLARYAAGEEAAFRAIVNRYKDSLYMFLKQFLNHRDLIDDVFQDTFLQLFTSRDSFDTTRPLRPW